MKMKEVPGWTEEGDELALLVGGPQFKKTFKGQCGYCVNVVTKQLENQPGNRVTKKERSNLIYQKPNASTVTNMDTFARDCPNKKDQANMSKEEEETTYLNDSHIDLLCASEDECAMVTQDSPSSEDLDDSIVTYGQQNSEKEHFEKIHYESIFEQESSSEEEISYNYPGKSADESTHVTKHPGEKFFYREQSMWHEGDDGKTAFEREQNEKYQNKILIKNEEKKNFLAQLMNHKNRI